MDSAQLRRFCLALPGATVDIKWGSDVCYCVGAKMFAISGMDSQGVCLKVEEPLFEFLTSRKGIIPAPYLARHHWIVIEKRRSMKRGELEALIGGSYDLVLANVG